MTSTDFHVEAIDRLSFVCGFTVNDRLSAAALIKVFRFLGAALIRLRRLFDCCAYFKD